MENAINILKKIWDIIVVVFRALKSKIALVILVVLVIVGGFTYISYRNYVENLPIVSLTTSIRNAIRTQMETTGSLYYNEVLDVTLPQGCHVEEVFVFEGDAVEADSPLLRIKVADLQVARLNKLLQIEALEEVEEEGGTEGELAYWKKELLLEELAELEKWIATEGIVKVESFPEVEGEKEEESTIENTSEGTTEVEDETTSKKNEDGEEPAVNPVRVIAQTYKKGDLTNMEVPITLGLPEGGCYLEWQISAKDYKEYKGTARIRSKKESLTWESPKYADGTYTYQSQVPMPENFVNGERVKVELNYVSDEYSAVLPKNCIWMDADGTTYVYVVSTRTCNYGEEQYVKKYGVTIVEQDATNAAIKGGISNVVQGSSKQLQDLMAVMVIK